jgi:archaellum component FlaG (FlaF/FlaG flagellin family)
MWMLRKLTKKRLVAGVVVLLALAVAGAALAYFTGGGSGTTQVAAVGTSSNLSVTFGTPTGAMYPGTGTDTIPFTITNAGSGAQELSAVAASVANDGSGNVTSSGAAVTGCLAAWFAASPGTLSAPVDLAASGQAGDSYSGTVTVTMSDSGTNQDACEGQTPDITVTGS